MFLVLSFSQETEQEKAARLEKILSTSLLDYKGEDLSIVNVGKQEEYLPPKSGSNISYRLWNLKDKEDASGKENVRVRA